MFSQYPSLKSYKVVELDERDDGDAIQDALGKVSRERWGESERARHSAAPLQPQLGQCI